MNNSQEEILHDPIVSRIPFFYGWLIVLISLTASILSSPAQTYGISVFNPFLREDLNLTHSQLSGAYMLGTLCASLLIYYVGSLIDRHGLRRTMISVVVIFGIACLFMSRVSSLFMLFLAFFMLRLTGQGALGLLTGNSVAMWFLRRLGKVTGIMNVILMLVIAVAPALFLWMIETFTWRMSYMIFGLVIWAVMLPLLLIFFRNRPEDVGQRMDGSEKDIPGEPSFFNFERDRSKQDWDDFTLKQAMRTRAYWILISLNVLWAMAITAITFHLIPLFEFQGLSKGVAIATFTSFALGGAGMQLIGGFLADRFRLNILLAISTIGFAVGLLFLVFLQSPWMGHAYAIIFGVSQGLFGVVLGTIWVRYYGREHLGKIRGTATTAIVLGSSIGPYLMGLTFDQTMSYSPSLSFFIFCSGIMAIAVWFATPPRRLL